MTITVAINLDPSPLASHAEDVHPIAVPIDQAIKRGAEPPRASAATAANNDDWTEGFVSEEQLASEAASSAARSWFNSWRRVALGVLVVVALAQAALIATWSWNRPAPPTEIGQLTISSEPAGASVVVDGEARGQSPVTLQLTPGSHAVDIVAGAFSRTQIVNVTRGGEASVHVEIGPTPQPSAPRAARVGGGLEISTDPRGARVWVDGTARGTTPLTLSNLSAGRHEVVVRSASSTVTRTVTVEEGSTFSMFIAINGAEFASGWLALTSPVPAQIFAGETLIGTTDTPRIMLAAGQHRLEIANPALDYRVTRTVEIKTGQTTAVTLDAPNGTLHVNALPWAEVFLDGERVGETPIGNLSLPIGNHELVFRHPGLGEQRKTVMVGARQPVRVGVDLRK